MKKLLLACCFIFFLASCTVAPQPVYQAKSLDHSWSSMWIQGREFIQLKNKDVQLVLVFDKIEDNVAIFDIEMQNLSNKTIDATHALFEMMSLNKEKKKLLHSEAINPEEKILETQLAQSKEKARYATEKNAKAVSRLFDAGIDVVDAANNPEAHKYDTTKKRIANEKMIDGLG